MSIAFEPAPNRFIFGYDDLRYRFAPEMDDPGDPGDPGDPVEMTVPPVFVLLGFGVLALGAARRRRR